jgi:hypothetical protein
MPGLSLNVGGYGAAAAPVAANQPAGPTISQQAFGITTGASRANRLATYGSVGAGLLGAAVLVWLWYSLPR